MLTPMSPANVLQASSDLNRILANCRLLTASYDLTAFENRLMLQWLFREGDGDVRYRLAAFLLSPEVQRRFDLVIIDTPPRATTTMVNALCAGHFLLVPTVLDRLSAETVANFMKQAKRLCREQGLNPTLEVLGAVPTLVAGINAESDAMPAVRDGLKLWGPNTHIFTAMRRNAEFSNYAGTDIAYLKSKAVRDDLIGPLGDEVAMRIGL
jgi:cellulose biosynthesis protein BcsQ